MFNGLLPGASIRGEFPPERWLMAEERSAKLMIACIQPNHPSHSITDYISGLILNCFQDIQVVTIGSVPLKTYIPGEDINLTILSDDPNLKDTWANQVQDVLENEKKNEIAEFHVKNIECIQSDSEAKMIKCLVENIVVEISFNQLGGLCTLRFLEEVDHLINKNNLFKRSIILVKAWCLYENRILGAHHGLISTYALETLVIYIFHVYNNSFAGPLEVLYRFLELFSNFDWKNYCVSLQGPVRISSRPSVTVTPEHPRKDRGELLLSQAFLKQMSSEYGYFPNGQENTGQQFVSKCFNVVDALCINNNLGRSVSKHKFGGIRRAFASGTEKLARILHCSEETIAFELNQFFSNTWDRYSNDLANTPRIELLGSRLSIPDDSPVVIEYEYENESYDPKELVFGSTLREDFSDYGPVGPKIQWIDPTLGIR